MTHHHAYETIVETTTGIIEVCKECKHRRVTKKDKKGRIDNEEYRKAHIRDFAQPTGPTKQIFDRYYKK